MNLNPRAVAVTPVQVTTSASQVQVPRRVPISREGGARKQSRSSTPLTKADLEKFHESHFPMPPASATPKAREEVTSLPPSAQILSKKGVRAGYSSKGDGKVFKHDNVTVKMPRKDGVVSEFDEEIPVNDVFQRIDAHIDDCHNHENHIIRRVRFYIFSVVSSILGIFLILIGLAATDLFSSLKPNVGILVVGCLCECPILVLVTFCFFTPEKEVRERRQLKQNRAFRLNALKLNDARLLVDSDAGRRSAAEARRVEEYQKHLEAVEFKKKNPLGYPTLGKTRHPNPW